MTLEREFSLEAKENKKFDYFEYDRLISLDFGSTWTKFAYYDIRNEQLVLDYGKACSYHPSACLYSCENNDYDNAVFEKWGTEAEYKRRKIKNALYVDKLLDKVEHLFKIEPDIKQPLQNAKDRLYFTAIVQYLKSLVGYIIGFINTRDSRSNSSKNRYVMTYPSHWVPKQVAYLRSLAMTAGILDEQDHPDRLIMYSEGSSVLRYLQEPHSHDKIKQGHKYLICDLGGSKVKMNLYDIKEPLDTMNNMKGESRCDWDISFMKYPSQLDVGAHNILQEYETHVLSKLSPPSKTFTLEDIDEQDGPLFDRREDFGRLVEDTSIIKDFSKELSAKNEPSHYRIPFLLQPQELRFIKPKKPNNSTPTGSFSKADEMSTEKPKRVVGKTMLTIHPSDLEENIFEPICDQIVQYLEQITQVVHDSIDAIIVVGGFCHSVYLMDLIVDACKRTSTKLLIPFKQTISDFNSYEIVCGAILKSMDKVEAHDPTPKIVFDIGDSDLYSSKSEAQKVLVYIDYGMERTRISYSHVRPGEYLNTAKTKHVTHWPGQSAHDIDFPTLGVMLIPKDMSDGSSRKKIMSLKEDGDHAAQFLKQVQGEATEYKYYTFEKDDQGIILVTHHRASVEKKSIRISYKDVEDLDIAQREFNTYADDTLTSIKSPPIHHDALNRAQGTHRYIDEYKFTVTRQRISAQEFSLLYFDYLIQFLYDHIQSKIGGELKDQFRFCITRDNQAYSKNFTLSDEDMHEVAQRCKMVSADTHHSHEKLLVLDRAEATAIYCRKMINSSDMNDEAAHLHFLQVHLHPNQCILSLNRVPFFDDKENDNIGGQVWESTYKYVKSKHVPFSMMDIISENLWTHIQTYQQSILKKCRRHRSSKRFYNSSNMQVFKEMLHHYISMTFLNIEENEKIHTIYICNHGQRDCCHVVIANMDLLEFGIVPAIHQFVSIIQGSVSNQCLYQGLQISDIFVMGEFLVCRDYSSYKFIEEILLLKLRKINFRRLDNLMLHSMTKNTEVTKIDIPQEEQVEDDDRDSLALISESGSVMYGLDPRNRLVERFASRTYAIRVQILEPNGRILNKIVEDDDEAVCVVYDKLNTCIKISGEELVPVIRKGSSLASQTTTGEEIHISFTINNYIPNQKIAIGLFTLEEDDGSSWDPKKSPESKFDQIQNFVIENCVQPTYPIIFKSRISQTKSYKFWVEYGKNEKKAPIYIRESILLKSCTIK